MRSRVVRLPIDVCAEIDNIRCDYHIQSFSEAARKMANNAKAARYASKKNLFDIDNVLDTIVDPFELAIKRRRR